MTDLTLNAKHRLLATSTYDQDSQPAQNQNVNICADVDEDSRSIIETELGDAKRGHAAAKARGHGDAVAAYESLISELERASSPVSAMQTETLVSNDTSDQPGMPCANPADCAVGDDTDGESEAADDVILGGPATMPCLLEADPDSEFDSDTGDLDPADPNGEDPLKQQTTARFFTIAELKAAGKRIRAEMEAKAGRPLSNDELHAMMNDRVLADTEDPISDGTAFDLLIDGDDEEDEPVVQELTNNDGGVEPDKLQPLLIDDVSQGPPTLD